MAEVCTMFGARKRGLGKGELGKGVKAYFGSYLYSDCVCVEDDFPITRIPLSRSYLHTPWPIAAFNVMNKPCGAT